MPAYLAVPKVVIRVNVFAVTDWPKRVPVVLGRTNTPCCPQPSAINTFPLLSTARSQNQYAPEKIIAEVFSVTDTPKRFPDAAGRTD